MKTSSCAAATNGYVKVMDWQRIAALTIVGATAAAFLAARLRKRKFSFEHHTHCGCSSPSGSKQSIVFHARKGGRAQITVKSN
jgi:hypothetical protein